MLYDSAAIRARKICPLKQLLFIFDIDEDLFSPRQELLLFCLYKLTVS